jgi:hypothetical protein
VKISKANKDNILYQITYNSDGTEGRGKTVRMNIYFEDKADALIFVKSKYYSRKYGVMGTPGCEYDIKSVSEESLVPNIYKNVYEFEDEAGERISQTREEVLKEKFNKMSKEELVKALLKKA